MVKLRCFGFVLARQRLVIQHQAEQLFNSGVLKEPVRQLGHKAVSFFQILRQPAAPFPTVRRSVERHNQLSLEVRAPARYCPSCDREGVTEWEVVDIFKIAWFREINYFYCLNYRFA